VLGAERCDDGRVLLGIDLTAGESFAGDAGVPAVEPGFRLRETAQTTSATTTAVKNRKPMSARRPKPPRPNSPSPIIRPP
jgi:hypothetical protein